MNVQNSPSNKLKQLIALKEQDLFDEGQKLKEHFLLAYESLLPFNILKSSLREAVSSSEVKTSISKISAGITLGYIANRLFTGGSDNPVKQYVGNIIGSYINNSFVQNADSLGIYARIAFRHVSKWSIFS